MKRKKTMIGLVTGCLICAFLLGCIFLHPAARFNSWRLHQKLQSISSGEVRLNEIVPFGWDAVYTFPPYTSVEEMERVIGFQSNLIHGMEYDDMVQILFVKDRHIVAQIYGHETDLGYRMEFSKKVTKKENAVFQAKEKDGIVYFSKHP